METLLGAEDTKLVISYMLGWTLAYVIKKQRMWLIANVKWADMSPKKVDIARGVCNTRAVANFLRDNFFTFEGVGDRRVMSMSCKELGACLKGLIVPQRVKDSRRGFRQRREHRRRRQRKGDIVPEEVGDQHHRTEQS